MPQSDIVQSVLIHSQHKLKLGKVPPQVCSRTSEDDYPMVTMNRIWFSSSLSSNCAATRLSLDCPLQECVNSKATQSQMGHGATCVEKLDDRSLAT